MGFRVSAVGGVDVPFSGGQSGGRAAEVGVVRSEPCCLCVAVFHGKKDRGGVWRACGRRTGLGAEKHDFCHLGVVHILVARVVRRSGDVYHLAEHL